MGLTRDYLKFVHSGICNLIGSPNGTIQCVDSVTCAVTSAESISFYNMRTVEKNFEIRCEQKIVTAFKLNGDKSMIAIGYNDGEIHIHERNREDSPIVFAGHQTGVNVIAFNSDGFIMASGGKDGMIVIWDLINESGICRFIGHKSTITHLQFAQNDQFLLSSSKDTQLRFWNMSNKSCFYTIAESSSEIYTFVLLNSDRLLIIGNAEIELIVFELRWFGQQDWNDFDEEENVKRIRDQLNLTIFDKNMDSQANEILRCKKRGTLIRQSKGHALQIAVSSDESIMCCVGSDSLLDVYRHFTDDESKKRFHKKLRKVRQRVKVEDETTLKRIELEVNNDITTQITRIGDYRADSKIKWVDFCESFTANILNGKTREYRLYCLLKANDVQGVVLCVNWKNNVTQGMPLATLGQLAHKTDVRTLTISSDFKFFVSASQESAIVWDLDTLLPLNKLVEEDMTQITASLIVTGDNHIVLGTRAGTLYLFDLKSCQLVEKMQKAHDDAITQICLFSYAEKGGFLSCGVDKKCRFWKFDIFSDIQGQRLIIKPVRILELPDEPLCVSISTNSKFVAFGLLDNTARVYYMDTLKFYLSLYGHSLPIHCIDISADSKLVITGSGDKSIKIWGLDFGDCHRSLFAHDDTVTCVQFCKDGDDKNLFWSAGKDGKLKQWDAIKFNHIQTLEGHTNHIDSIALTSDSKLLISASRDKSIRIWQLSDEIVVLQEEEENKREKEYEQKLLEDDDIVPGEAKESKDELAPVKSIETIKSAEKIIDAIELVRNEHLQRAEDCEYKGHILLKDYPKNSEHCFLIDTIQKIRQSHLEKSLLSLPFSYVPELLSGLCKCLRVFHKPEIVSRTILFLLRIHHNQIVHSLEFLSIIDELRTLLPEKINVGLNRTGFNVAALKFLQKQLKEKNNLKFFDLNEIQAEMNTKKRKTHKKKNI